MAKSATEKKEYIVAKALQCIDEVYPDSSTSNSINFPTETFFDEVVRWVIDSIPASIFNASSSQEAKPTVTSKGYHGEVSILEGDLNSRVLNVYGTGWERPVVDPITDSSPLYKQQKNKVLRGNATRPVAVIIKRSNLIELYPCPTGVTIKLAKYIVDHIPEVALDVAAWKLAETVLLSISDTSSAAICTAKVNEHLELLAK